MKNNVPKITVFEVPLVPQIETPKLIGKIGFSTFSPASEFLSETATITWLKI